jgi:hypothetical protein
VFAHEVVSHELDEIRFVVDDQDAGLLHDGGH